MKTYLLYVLLIGIGILIGYLARDMAKTKVLPQNDETTKSCIYKGITYTDGEGFKDECNSCSCQNGEVNCTTIACGSELR